MYGETSYMGVTRKIKVSKKKVVLQGESLPSPLKSASCGLESASLAGREETPLQMEVALRNVNVPQKSMTSALRADSPALVCQDNDLCAS